MQCTIKYLYTHLASIKKFIVTPYVRIAAQLEFISIYEHAFVVSERGCIIPANVDDEQFFLQVHIIHLFRTLCIVISDNSMKCQ